MPRTLAFLLSLLFSLSALQAQDEYTPPEEEVASPDMTYSESKVERHDFDEARWKSLKKGMNYGRTQPKEKKKEQQPDLEQPTSNESNEFGPLAKTLFFVLIGGLLILLIVMLADGKRLFGPKDNKLKPAVSASELEKIEENLHEAELDDPIRRAVLAGDYPLAVRLYYLAMLKELTIRKLIRWKRDKTNGAYLRELAGSPLFDTVQQVTLIFERVWYGKVELSKQDFEELEIQLKHAVATASTTG